MGKEKQKTGQQAEQRTNEEVYFVMDTNEHDHYIEYVIKTYDVGKNNRIELFVADNGTWSRDFSGQKLASVLNTGDGYKWDLMPISEEQDYVDAYAMLILLNFLDGYQSSSNKYKIVKVVSIVTVSNV
ncbi:hypothetical protein EB118_15085 [bacterium]|nr:hypothetical protein [bacterium]NDD82673.1 hypothetical protein [bacterium]NDG31380.1 hypothetical protein [bacterium]